MANINQGAVRGETGTGFEKRGDKGPFECANCEHFSGRRCDQPDMKKMSKQPRDADGNVIVDALDCCEYIERMGSKSKRRLFAETLRKRS